MDTQKEKGKFIVFEGLDGSGQSTQVKLLTEYLTEQGFSVLSTKEPTQASPFGKQLKHILEEKIKTRPQEIQALFIKDREWHLDNIVKPALKEGKIVITDRYLFSTLAYGKADNVDEQWLLQENSKFLKPDLLFFLSTKPEICLQRIEKRGEPIKLFEKLEKLRAVYENFKYFLKQFEKTINIYYIDGGQDINNVFNNIKNICQQYLKQNN